MDKITTTKKEIFLSFSEKQFSLCALAMADDQEEVSLEMAEKLEMNHKDPKPKEYVKETKIPRSPGIHRKHNANSGYNSDHEDIVSRYSSRIDLNLPGGPYASGPVKHDPLPPPDSRFYHFVHDTQSAIYGFWDRHKVLIKRIILVVLLSAYFVYLGFAIDRSVNGAAGLIAVTVFMCLYFIYKAFLEKPFQRCTVPCCHKEWWIASNVRNFIRIVLLGYVVVLAFQHFTELLNVTTHVQ